MDRPAAVSRPQKLFIYANINGSHQSFPSRVIWERDDILDDDGDEDGDSPPTAPSPKRRCQSAASDLQNMSAIDTNVYSSSEIARCDKLGSGINVTGDRNAIARLQSPKPQKEAQCPDFNGACINIRPPPSKLLHDDCRLSGHYPGTTHRDFGMFMTPDFQRLEHPRNHFTEAHDGLNSQQQQQQQRYGKSLGDHASPSYEPGPHRHQSESQRGFYLPALDSQEKYRSESAGGCSSFNRFQYERKAGGVLAGMLVSPGTVVRVDGEDFVEYSVLAKPSFA